MEKVVSYCDEVLKNAPSNDKALFRKSQALFKLGDFDGALTCCLEANKLQKSSGNKVK
jgi:tetratricopeptide (TPR) repeat protein